MTTTMRIGFVLIVVWISLFLEPVSNGQQTLPGFGTLNTKPLPPIVVVQPQVEPSSPERSRSESLRTLDQLLNEARALQRELNETSERTVSTASVKRSERIESLAKSPSEVNASEMRKPLWSARKLESIA
jgi:hypothetical protein